MNLFPQYLKALQKSGIAFFLAYLAFTFFDQGLTQIMEADLRSPNGASSWVFLYAGLYLANNIFFTTLVTVLGIFGLTATTSDCMMSFIKKHLNQNCIEVLRSWGKILAWSFLLVIPGFIKYLQLLLVPFITSLDPAYQDGKVDALAASKKIFKKHWTSLVFVVFGFQILWSGISLIFFDGYRLLLQTPFFALLICLLEAAVFLFYISILFRTYKKTLVEG